MAVDHVAKLKVANEAHETAKERTKRARDKAILQAHEDGGLTYQQIAAITNMSHGNVIKIVRTQRANL